MYLTTIQIYIKLKYSIVNRKQINELLTKNNNDSKSN